MVGVWKSMVNLYTNEKMKIKLWERKVRGGARLPLKQNTAVELALTCNVFW